jgi:two-component system, NtrC family, sensor kinase
MAKDKRAKRKPPDARKPGKASADNNMEIAALRRELTEAHQREAATADVLKVISRSTFDLQTVLDTLVESAARLCNADMATMTRPRGEFFEQVAWYGFPADRDGALKAVRIPAGRGTLSGRTFLEGKVVQIEDIQADPEHKTHGTHGILAELDAASPVRTMLGVPLVRDGATIGVFALQRKTVQPFTDKQIELVATFADQAVIAIENARMFDEVQARTKELTESLEQQTATSDVLQVISSSPGELAPVFKTILENATRICEAIFGQLLVYDGGAFRCVAFHNTPSAFVEQFGDTPFVPTADGPGGRLVQTKQPVHVADLRADVSYRTGSAASVATVELAGARSMIVVPMLKEGQLLGALAIYHQEIRPFTDKQIELVSNFARQAVIAIENTRLLNELRQRTDDLSEALDQQTATSGVLRVIGTSQGALEPVFEIMLANATRICEARFGGLFLSEGDSFRAVAMHGDPRLAQFWRQNPLQVADHPSLPLARLARIKQIIHIPDLAVDEAYIVRNPRVVALVDSGGARTLLLVPMLKENELVGAIGIYRQEMRPFTTKQIELVTNFAAQAVIAIENARLLKELRQRTADLTESLEQQTATSEVLQIISSSQGELRPVFDAMLENATRICGATFGSMLLYNGDHSFRRVAIHNAPSNFAKLNETASSIRIHKNPTLTRLVETKQTIHVADLAVEGPDEPIAKYAGARTLLVVPMLKEDELIGAIGVYRQEVQLFTDKQIELVQSFANQALIAIENARLLNELRESLQQQIATADVLKVISRSTFDLQTVLDTLTESAARLCEADQAVINRYVGSSVTTDAFMRAVAFWGFAPEAISYLEEHLIPMGRSSAAGRAVMDGRAVHIPDVLNDAEYEMKDSARVGNVRTLLAVPLIREGTPIGTIAAARPQRSLARSPLRPRRSAPGSA